MPLRRRVSSVLIISDCKLLKNIWRFGINAVTILIEATNCEQTTTGRTATVKFFRAVSPTPGDELWYNKSNCPKLKVNGSLNDVVEQQIIGVLLEIDALIGAMMNMSRMISKSSVAILQVSK